jgi:hypothetical protein
MIKTSSFSLPSTSDGHEHRPHEEDDDSEYEELIPPENFAMIEKGLYRSKF